MFASLNHPAGIAVDSLGNLYIADALNNRVRRIDPQGDIATIAGTGTAGFAGDGGPAVSAQLNLLAWNCGLAVDSSGSLYIADSGNNRVRKVTPEGIITTVAGNGALVFSGDGGPATAAQLNPFAVAVDGSGNLFIADAFNNRVRMVTPQGIIGTVAGGASGFSGDGGPATMAGLSQPAGIAIDSSANLYIADAGNNRIRVVNSQGVIETIAGNGSSGSSGDGGPAISAALNNPSAVTIDSSGNLLIADFFNYRIRAVTPQGIIQTVAAGSGNWLNGDGGPAANVEAIYPSQIAADANGNVFIADSGLNNVRELVATATPTAGCAYSLGGGSAQNVTAAGGTSSIAVQASGNGCSWMAVSDSDWIAAGPPAGGSVESFNAGPNLTLAPRTGLIWVAGIGVSVNQAAGTCSTAVAPQNVFVPSSGVAGATLAVNAIASSCGWTAAANAPWIAIDSANTGTGSQSVAYSVAANTGGRRSGTMAVAGQTVSVTQEGGCNVTGDSQTSVADIQSIINQALGMFAAYNDLTGKGAVNVTDVQIVMNAALNLGCGAS